jgi:hypothetical protein
MCLTRDLLVRFYDALNFSLRVFVHYRVMVAFGKPFDYFLVEEPWRVYEVLEKAVGKHTTGLIINILTDWLRKNGCNMTQDQVLHYLTAREAWG